MNFQEKLFETTADLRARAAALANVAVATARARAEVAAKRVEALKGSIAVLTVAGREFNKVARRHAVRFVKQNSTIAAEAAQGRLRTGAHRPSRRSAKRAAAEPKARKAAPLAQARARARPPDRPPVASPRGSRHQCAPFTGRAAFLMSCEAPILLALSSAIAALMVRRYTPLSRQDRQTFEGTVMATAPQSFTALPETFSGGRRLG